MTAKEFNQAVERWSRNIDQTAGERLASMTHGSGKLKTSIESKYYVKDSDKAIHGVAFRFDRYGVFVHYGVGRGYVREGGVVQRGSRIANNKELVSQYRKRGYRDKEIRTMKYIDSYQKISRTPKNWLDITIVENIQTLASLSGEFFGDSALQRVLKTFDSKLLIEK